MSKSQDATSSNARVLDLAGLPPLPSSTSSKSSVAMEMNVVERLQSNATTAVRPALTVLSRERPSASLYDKSIATVRGLLTMYSVEELDTLLISCDKGEREVLLKSLIKR